MFDIGWGELLVIGIVALVVIGPKELPGALRTLGQFTAKLRRMASEFQGQFHEAMREAEMADLKKQVDEMTSQAQSYASFDPVSDIRKEFETTQQQIEGAFTDKPPDTTTPSAAAEPAPSSSPAPVSAEPALTPQGDAHASASHVAAPAPEPAAATSEPAKPDAGGKPA
jgi:sec-independent protein translocase protein TatB